MLFSCCFPTRAHSPLDPPQLLLRVFKFDDLEEFLFAVRAEDAAGDLAEELLEHRGDGVDGEGVDVDEAALKREGRFQWSSLSYCTSLLSQSAMARKTLLLGYRRQGGGRKSTLCSCVFEPLRWRRWRQYSEALARQKKFIL